MAIPSPIDPTAKLAENFDSFFNISKPIENDTARPHPKFASYCRKFCVTSPHDDVKRLQEKRRMEMLERLKRKREEILNNLRPMIAFIEDRDDVDYDDIPNICDDKITKNADFHEKNIVLDPLQMETEDTGVDIIKNFDVTTSMQVDGISKRNVKNRKKRNSYWTKNEKDFRKLLSKQLMLSEWLVDVPSDFYQNWYLVCCPRGKRTLVVAANGRTTIYSRTGYYMFHFQSKLPGGSKNTSKYSVKRTILDCIYVEGEQKFYVLDVISWNGCSFFGCETEFRFYWIHSRFEELNKIEEETPANNDCDIEMIENVISKEAKEPICVFKQSISELFSFSPLTYDECTAENIKLVKGPYSFRNKLDGVLFYHKQAIYTPGITPLVCWLKLDMIPKILNVSLD